MIFEIEVKKHHYYKEYRADDYQMGCMSIAFRERFPYFCKWFTDIGICGGMISNHWFAHELIDFPRDEEKKYGFLRNYRGEPVEFSYKIKITNWALLFSIWLREGRVNRIFLRIVNRWVRSIGKIIRRNP